jgi:hypothetical protein
MLKCILYGWKSMSKEASNQPDLQESQLILGRRGFLERLIITGGGLALATACSCDFPDLSHPGTLDPKEGKTINPNELPSSEQLRVLEAKTEIMIGNGEKLTTRGGILKVEPPDGKKFFLVNPILTEVEPGKPAVGFVHVQQARRGERYYTKAEAHFFPYREGDLGYMRMQWVTEADATETVQKGSGTLALVEWNVPRDNGQTNSYGTLPNGRLTAFSYIENDPTIQVVATASQQAIPFGLQIFDGDQVFLGKDCEIKPYLT